jgi:hypothetical protein
LPGAETEPPRIVTELDPGVRLRGFVPVELAAGRSLGAVTAATVAKPASPPIPGPAFDSAEGWTNRTSLFGDAEA